MKRSTGFIPAEPVGLERRVVLSHAAARVPGSSVVVDGLFPGRQVLNRKQQPVIAEVNQAFAEFKTDYGQARATYFASIRDQTTLDTATTNAFIYFTRERVALLAQQVVSSYLQSPLGTSRAKGQQPSVQVIVAKQLTGPQSPKPSGVSLNQVSLVQALVDTTPPPGTSAATASLYSLSQDNAIEAARVAVVNGVTILRNGSFGNKSHGH